MGNREFQEWPTPELQTAKSPPCVYVCVCLPLRQQCSTNVFPSALNNYYSNLNPRSTLFQSPQLYTFFFSKTNLWRSWFGGFCFFGGTGGGVCNTPTTHEGSSLSFYFPFGYIHRYSFLCLLLWIFCLRVMLSFSLQLGAVGWVVYISPCLAGLDQ